MSLNWKETELLLSELPLEGGYIQKITEHSVNAAKILLHYPVALGNGIFVFVTIDYHIFYACSHFLSVSERKSRINSFSISNRLIYLSLLATSYCN